MANEVEIKITADDQASATFGKVQGHASGLSTALKVGLAGAGIAVAAGFAAAVSAASGFEHGLSAVKAVSGATGDEMKLLSDKALQIGKDTAFSASQAVGAMEELVKAGLSVNDVLGGAADAAVALAAAGGVTIPEAATLAANAMNAFGIEAKDMAGVVDLIAGAANASAIDVGEFGFSLQMVGAVANLAGISFNDTATAIALMGNAGIKGSDAGTSLKTMLMNLDPATKSAKKAFKELGIITAEGVNQFIRADGSIKSLAEISGILKAGTDKLTDAQGLMALKMAFGTDAVRAAAIMAKEGAEGFNTLNAEMLKTSAADVAATRMDNFSGSMEQLKGSMETMAIIVGMAMMPALRQVIDGATELANFIIANVLPVLGDFGKYIMAVVGTGDSMNDWLAHLPSFLQPVAAAVGDFVVTLVKIGGVIKERMLPALQDFGSWMLAHESVMKAVAVALGLILAALFPIPAAIMGVIAVVSLLSQNWDSIKAKTIEVWTTIKDFLSGVLTALVGEDFIPQMAAIFASVTETWDAVSSKTEEVWGAISAFIKLHWDTISAFLDVGLTALLAFWKIQWDLIRGYLEFQWNLISGIIKIAWDLISGIILVGLALLRGDWDEAWQAVKDTAAKVWEDIKSLVTDAIQIVLETVQNVADDLLDAGKAMVQAIWDGIASKKDWLFGQVKDFAGGIFNSVKEGLGKLWPGSPSEAGRDIAIGLGAGITTEQAGIESIAEVFGKAIADSMYEGTVTFLGHWATFVRTFRAAIDTLIPQVSAWGHDIGYTFAQGVAAGIQAGQYLAVNAAVQMVQAAEAAARAEAQTASPSKLFAKIGEFMSKGLAIGMERGTPAIAAAGAGMVQTAAGSVTNSNTQNYHMGGVTLSFPNVSNRADAEGIVDEVIKRLGRKQEMSRRGIY